MDKAFQLFKLAKEEFIRSNVDRKHPFRYFTLATFAAYPEIRTVVKREINKDLNIVFFTDSRSPKVFEIEKNNRISALFYHSKKQLQIRIKGEAQFIKENEKDFQKYLNIVQAGNSTQDYTTLQSPSTPILEKLAFGEKLYFLPIKIIPKILDILLLSPSGHQRAKYTLNQNNEWLEQKLVP